MAATGALAVGWALPVRAPGVPLGAFAACGMMGPA